MTDDLDSLWKDGPNKAAPTSAPTLDDLWNDNTPKAAAQNGAAPNAPSAPADKNAIGQPTQSKAIIYGLANSIPFAHDIGAAIQAGETYLPKWAATDDIGETDPSATFSDRFSQQKKRIGDVDSGLVREFPKTSLLTPIVAGAATLPVSGPVEATSNLLGRALPLVRGLPSDIAASGLVGAGYGGLYGAGNGDTLSERVDNAKSGAGLGAAAGAAAPVLGRVLGGLYNTAASKLGFGADREAQAAVQAARNPASEMSPTDISNAQTANQPITAADVYGSPQIKRLLDKAATGSPDAQGTIKNILQPRADEQAGRTKAFMQDIFNSNLEPQEILDEINSNAQIANAANYKQAFSDPKAQSVWNDGLKNLIQAPQVKQAIADANTRSQTEAVLEREAARSAGMPVPNDPIVKNPFVTDSQGNLTLPTDPQTGQPTITPNLKFWDIVKRNLDSQHDNATGDFGKATDQSRLINGLRKGLLSNLDDAVPSYAQARAGAAGFFGENNAFMAGMKYLSQKNALQSSQADAAVNALNPAQKSLFAQGVAVDMVQKAQNPNVRQNALRQFNTPATAQKLRNALGPYADKVESFLRVEDRMAQTKQAIESSLTGQRNVDQGMHAPLGHGVIGAVAQSLGPVAGGAVLGGVGNYEGGHDPFTGAMYGAGAGALLSRGNAHARAVNEAIARMLMEGDPQKIAKTASAISQKPGLLNALRGVAPKPASQLAVPTAGQIVGRPSSSNQQLQPAFAKGGAVKRKTHEELVSRLMNACEEAKRATKRETKQILNVPDSTVARALEVANRAI